MPFQTAQKLMNNFQLNRLRLTLINRHFLQIFKSNNFSLNTAQISCCRIFPIHPVIIEMLGNIPADRFAKITNHTENRIFGNFNPDGKNNVISQNKIPAIQFIPDNRRKSINGSFVI